MARSIAAAIRVRRALLLAASVAIPFALVRWGGHVGMHTARNLLFPGAGLVDRYWGLALVFAVLAVAATVLWLNWGAGWVVGAVVVVSSLVSALLAGVHDADTASAVGPGGTGNPLTNNLTDT